MTKVRGSIIYAGDLKIDDDKFTGIAIEMPIEDVRKTSFMYKKFEITFKEVKND